MNECPQGIKNEKDLERLGDKVAIMFDQLEKGVDKLDKKLDQLDRKIEELKKSIPEQIEQSVEAKWKTGVYDLVKWLVIAVVSTAIAVTVKMIMGG